MTARSSDPKTSKDAGQLATTPAKLRASHALILNVFTAYGDTHDKGLIERVHVVEKNLGVKRLMSPSGIRSRRSEMSKPNMERLGELFAEYESYIARESDPTTEAARSKIDREAREQLRREGYRSKLIDTGRREVVDGRSVVIWGLAK